MIRCPDTFPPPHPCGLGPVAGPDPAILILGSFPSAKSLRYSEYYGNPQNHFWSVMEALSGISAGLPYPQRISGLQDAGIALWDVVGSCSRPGSADARITGPVFNDIAGFAAMHPTLQIIALNGSTAGRYFQRISGSIAITSVVLPSTSPANTRFTLAEKIERWSVLKKMVR